MFAVFFAASVLLAFAVLCTVALPDVPAITGTAAVIVALAALAAVLIH